MEARLNIHRIWSPWTVPLLGLVLVASLAACASSQRPTVVQASTASEASATPETQLAARQIEAMSLRAGETATYLDLTANDALVWTSYRDEDGHLVVELPNAVVSPGVVPASSAEGLIADVRVEQENGTSRPLTRLTVVTRGEAEHSLKARGQRLELTLLPVGEAYGEQVASYEPLPEDVEEPSSTTDDSGLGDAIADAGDPVNVDPVNVDASPVLADDSTDVAAASAPATIDASDAAGDPSTWSADATVNAASMLQGVALAAADSGTALRVSGDGRFAYSGFQLENPNRFVIDLMGIVNASSSSTVTVDTGSVDRVRIAQFKPFPEPVTRVVFDLADSTAPTIQQLPDGLLVVFGGSGVAASTVVAPPEESLVAEAEPTVADSLANATEEDSRSAWEREYGSAEIGEADPDAQFQGEKQLAEMDSGGEDSLSDEYSSYSEAQVVRADDAAPAQETYAEADLEPAELTPLPQDEVVTEQIEPVAEVELAEVAPADEAGEVESDSSLEDSYYAAWTDEAAAGDLSNEDVVDSAPPVMAEIQPSTPVVPEPLAPVPSQIAETSNAGANQPTSDVALFEAAQVEYAPPAQQSDSLTTTVGGSQVIGQGGKIYSGDLITLRLQDADIKDVLRTFSRITGLNVVVHPGVRGSVTVELTDVPWDQALDLILKINGLDYVLEGNIMRIASTQQLEQEAASRRALAAARAQEVPLQTVIRAVSYADANQIARLLTTGSGARNRGSASILTSRGAVTVDRRTNKLIIKELPANMNTVLAIIANLDTAEPQVLIEARIVETTKSFSRSLGINWQFDAQADDRFGNATGLAFPHRASASGGVNLVTGGNSGFLDISLGNILDTFTLDASLAAAENEGLVSILSSPKIATLNNQEARIESGLQIPVQTVSNNTVSVQFVNATLSLEVTPQVTAEGTVIMDIDIAKREPQLAFAIAGATNAPIATKQARTRVIVRDGGTTVIGGIYEVATNRGEDRVPGLANVPILGYLFKNRRTNNDNEELLIFITPRVIQL